MRTGIYGGTFNPVHKGHVKLARAYFGALSLDRLLVVPTHIPPHKESRDLAEDRHRLAMCRLAFAGAPGCEVSDLEVKRGSRSYTVDTLEELQRRFPDDTFYLIMGSDMFETLTEWYDWPRIFELAVICAGARAPGQRAALQASRERLEALGARCELVDMEPLPFSSTMVRKAARAGEPLEGLVGPAVARYILDNGLYR